MLPTLPYFPILTILVCLLASYTQAQDVIHLMDNTQLDVKVQEVGIDSVRYITTAKKEAKTSSIPKAFIKYIEYKNGQTYFVEHSKIYLTDGRIVLALVKEYDDKHVEYLDIVSRKLKTIPIRKVATIYYNKDEQVNFADKINLQDGDHLFGQVLEIKEEELVFENKTRRNKKETLRMDLVESIEFKNGFEQHFSSTQPNN